LREPLERLLRCPLCRSPLQAKAFVEGEGELIDGLVRCRCGGEWPVVGGVARIIEDPLREHPEFAARYNLKPPGGAAPVFARTRESFGRQWTTYDVYRAREDEATFRTKTGFSPELARGKRVLDAGCGSGRYAAVAAAWGAAEVVAFDLGRGVERAFSLNRDKPNVHFMQANIFSLPLAERSFDFIYSIGVLHHTPDTRRAFRRLLPLLAPGGRISIWLYKKRDPLYEAVNTILRGFTKRMDHADLARWARLAVPLGGFKRWAFERRWTAILSKLIPTVSTHPDPAIRVCDTFDWYSPQFQWHHTDEEVERWFREAGLEEVTNLSIGQKLYHEGQGEGVNFSGTRPL
jgi:SAM-dependent methyltransferase